MPQFLLFGRFVIQAQEVKLTHTAIIVSCSLFSVGEEKSSSNILSSLTVTNINHFFYILHGDLIF